MKKINKFLKRIAVLNNRFGLKGLHLYFKVKFSSKPIISFKFKQRFQHPIYLRKASSDFPTFFEVLLNNDYNIPVNFTPKTIIDCGANIGLTSVYFKNRFPDATVIAVEAEKQNYEMVKMNLSNYSNTKIYHKGIWNKTALLKVNNIGLGNWGFTVTETDKVEEADIEAISIKDLMIENNLNSIDILKIDIEGSEKNIFESDYDYWLSKTKILIIELHDRLNHGTSKVVFKALENYNFSLILKGQNLVFYME